MYKIAFIIVVIILLVYLEYVNRSADKYISGFWLATDDFCQRSDSSSITLYISKAEGLITQTRDCYVIIWDSDGTNVMDAAFTIKHDRAFALNCCSNYKFSAEIESDEDNIINQIWAEDVKIKISMCKGTIKISDGDTSFFEGYKHHNLVPDEELI